MDNMKNLRHAKRSMSVPSPFVCVEWWRICLDEAQMVHSTNAKCGEMANRLYAINRRCVTGTPK
jgi:E3 ubiquitin-protein ligase SHPRH